MKIDDVIKIIEKEYPQTLSESYQKKSGFHDNYGLICGNRNEEFTKMVVTLDLSDTSIDSAIRQGANLIFTHHPIIYYPVPNITTDNLVGRLLIKCIKNNISVYSSHLTQDMSCPGTNYSLAMELGKKATPFKYDEIGCIFSENEKLIDLVKDIKNKLNCDTIRYTGNDDSIINNVLIIGGELGSLTDEQIVNISKEAQAVITGEAPYHTARYLLEKGISLIEITHQVTEESFAKHVSNKLKEMGIEAIGVDSPRIYKGIKE